ncbi:hypothetical protein RQP46_010595 [Phenoliferia psychrophenolica]
MTRSESARQLDSVADESRHWSGRVDVGTATFVLQRIHTITINTLLVVVCLQLRTDGLDISASLYHDIHHPSSILAQDPLSTPALLLLRALAFAEPHLYHLAQRCLEINRRAEEGYGAPLPGRYPCFVGIVRALAKERRWSPEETGKVIERIWPALDAAGTVLPVLLLSTSGRSGKVFRAAGLHFPSLLLPFLSRRHRLPIPEQVSAGRFTRFPMSRHSPPSDDRTIRFGHDEGRGDEMFYPASPIASFSSPGNEHLPQTSPAFTRYQLHDDTYPGEEREAARRRPHLQDSSAPRNPAPATFNPSFEISEPHGSNQARYSTYGTDPFNLTSPSPISPLRSAHMAAPAPRGGVPSFAYPSSSPRKASHETLYDSSPLNSKTGKDNRDTAAPLDSRGQPAKPSLRRSSTEEHQRHLAARQAINLVETHKRDFEPRRRGQYSSARSEDDEDELELGLPRGEHERAAGVLSNLLKLYGNQKAAGGFKRSTSCQTSSSAEGEKSEDERGRRPSQLRRTQSDASVATTFVDEDEMVDPFDPRNKKAPKKSAEAPELDRRRSYSDDGAVEEKVKPRKPSKRESKVYNAMSGKKGDKGGKSSKDAKERELHITAEVADILQRQNFILKLAKALMTFGAPSHRLESQLNATAKVLDVDAQFVHIPSVVIASFGDGDTHTSETKFVKASGGLNLGQLHDVHGVYRSVVHFEITVEEGSLALTKMLQADPIYNLWQRMIISAMCCGLIAPLGFGGSFVDAFASGAFGATLAFLQLYAAKKNAIFSNIFEISVAALISFVSRGLARTNFFCYEAISSSGVVLVLPGYIILCGSLELASKNLVAGSVRMVYAIIYTLFLGFSIVIGSDLYFLFDPAARHAGEVATAVSATVLQGTFSASNTSDSFMGSFSFTNTTATVSTAQASLQKGNVMCYRDPSWECAGAYWLFLLVPGFSFFLSLWNLQPLRSKELPVMVLIAVIGFVTNRLATQYIFDRSDIVSFIGATCIGLLGNMYSRVFKGTSFTAMATGVLFLVPSGIAAAGGLAMTQSGGDSFNSGLTIASRMVQVAVGITIGLFFASFCVYSVGTKKSSGSLGFAF